MRIESHSETLGLRTALRELVALSTIPAAWVGREPDTIAAGLADVLVGSLDLEFAFVRLCDPKGGEAIELTRGHAWKAFPEWLRTRLGGGRFSCREIVADLGGAEPCRGVVIPIGVNAEGGLVAAACTRTDFPSEIDHLLLSVAANHAAAAFQNARLRRELDAKVAELRQARDELEMKVAERTAELRSSEAYLAEAQRLTRTGSWAWKAAPRQSVYWSPENYRLFGFDPEEGIPSDEAFYERVHPEDRDRVRREVFLEKPNEGSHFDVEFRIVLPGGAVKYVRSTGHPVRDTSGELLEYVGTSIDVTERKRADEERERLRHLEADLAHINRVSMMGELAASLAHEIKQPMAAAATNANTCQRWLQREPPDTGEARAAVSRIVKDVNRAADMIERTRSLYKRDTPKREMVNLNELIREMIALLQDAANRHSVSIRAELDGALPAITADRVQLQQVLSNLMLNGVEAMKDTSGELTITSKRTEDGQLLITVSDSGIGLPVEESDRIFEAFYTTKQQGTGMGLSISRRIIESHGGRLWACANTGCGATFQFTMPTEVRASSASAG